MLLVIEIWLMLIMTFCIVSVAGSKDNQVTSVSGLAIIFTVSAALLFLFYLL